MFHDSLNDVHVVFALEATLVQSIDEKRISANLKVVVDNTKSANSLHTENFIGVFVLVLDIDIELEVVNQRIGALQEQVGLQRQDTGNQRNEIFVHNKIVSLLLRFQILTSEI